MFRRGDRRRWSRARRLLAGAFALLLLVPQAGCWDYHAVTSRAFILGMAVDPAPEGGYRITLQVAIPVKMKASGGGAGGGAGAGAGPDFFLERGTGRTLVDALANIQQHTGRVLFFGHMRTVIFGEELAAGPDGLEPIVEEIARYPPIDKLGWAMVARGASAGDLFSVTHPGEKLPSLFLSMTFDNARIQDATIPVSLFEFFIRGWEPGRFEGLPTVEITMGQEGSPDSGPTPGLAVRGFALFDNWKPVGWLSSEETRDLLFLRGRARHVGLSLPREERGQYDEVRHLTARTRLKPVVGPGGDVRFEIEVRVVGDVAEVAGRQMQLTSQDMLRVQKETERFLEERLQATMERLKLAGADVLGLGSHLYYRYPAVWDAINWDEYYRTVPVRITVRVRLVRKGLTT
ncbi:MAG: Ger(x)C family spore germination protein [Bacillota bacterium]